MLGGWVYRGLFSNCKGRRCTLPLESWNVFFFSLQIDHKSTNELKVDAITATAACIKNTSFART